MYLHTTVPDSPYNKEVFRLQPSRILGEIRGDNPGPTCILLGGIHGNEPMGVLALKAVVSELLEKNIDVSGTIYALAGNLGALREGTRYLKEDLNRMWSADRLKKLITAPGLETNPEEAEQQKLYSLIRSILTMETGPFYFMDLHTTSCETRPFITVNDNLLNRKFTSRYPLPIVLGIEEYLDGPILSYINEMGYIAFGFEGGQNDDPKAIDNHKAFVYLSLVFSGCVKASDIDFVTHFNHLQRCTAGFGRFYEIYFRHHIDPGQSFQMAPGYTNFQPVKRGQLLAHDSVVRASSNSHIFMPLYQDQGDDGFFLIRPIPNFFLRLSAYLRKFRFERLLVLLPGVKWASKSKRTLLVNRRIARILTKQIFHLLGYRSWQTDASHYIMKSREAVARTHEYPK